jgi:hypothetical protein
MRGIRLTSWFQALLVGAVIAFAGTMAAGGSTEPKSAFVKQSAPSSAISRSSAPKNRHFRVRLASKVRLTQ